MKLYKKIFIGLGVTLVLVVLLMAGLSVYVNQNSEEIKQEVEKLYRQNYNGKLSFDKISLKVFHAFPNTKLTIENLKLENDLFPDVKNQKIIEVEKAYLSVDLLDLMSGEIHIKGLGLKNGKVNFYSDSLGNANYKQLAKHESGKKKAKKNLIGNNLKIKIEKTQFTVNQINLNKKFDFKVRQLKSEIRFENNIILTETTLDTQVNLGFNLEKGTFFNNAQLKADIEIEWNKADKKIQILPFTAKIDKQKFLVKGKLDLTDSGQFYLDITNEKTDYKSTVQLLSQNIQKPLVKYGLSQPFYAHATLKGGFEHGENPLVKIDFKTQDNTITSHSGARFDAVNFTGNFINRIENDSLNRDTKKDVFLQFDTLTAKYKKVPISIWDTWLQTMDGKLPKAQIRLSSEGESKLLNEALENQDFLFTDGKYTYKTEYSGEVPNLKNLFRSANSHLVFNKNTILYKPEEIPIYLDTLNLTTTNNTASLNALELRVGGAQKIKVKGEIQGVTGIAIKDNVKPKTLITVTADMIDWEKMSKRETINKNPKSKNKNKRIGILLQDIYQKFNPQIQLSINQFNYKEFDIKNIQFGLNFLSKNKMKVSKSAFNYKNGRVELGAIFKFEKDGSTRIDLDAETQKIDLQEFLEDVNYLGIEALKKAKKVSGKLDLKAHIKGSVNAHGEINKKSLNGKAEFELYNTQINGFEPLQKIGHLVSNGERFEKVRFAPMKNKLTIKNGNIKIPRMSIISNAFYLYVEGVYSYVGKSHIWVSLPLNNLKKKESNQLYKQLPYQDSGSKVFVEIIENQHKFNYKLRLNNKKLYEQKGILDQYKEDKKTERERRKILRN